MEKTPRCTLRRGIITVILTGFFLVWAVPACNNEAPWTERDVVKRWGPTPIDRPATNYLQYGWDSTHHFYAASAPGGITIVDRLNKRTCTLSTAASSLDAKFDTNTFEVYARNQYGWSTTTSLDLQKWEVTTTVYGSCFQWMSCRLVDPPQVTLLGYCDPRQVYELAGLY